MGKNEDPYFTVRTEKTRLIRYLLYLSCWRKETISTQSRLHLNDARVKCKKKAKFIGLRKQFAVGSQRRESKLQTFLIFLRLIHTAPFCGKLDTVQDYFEITPEVM